MSAVDVAADALAEAMREYEAEVSREKYWADPEAARQQRRDWRARNRPHHLHAKRALRNKNIEKVRQQDRDYEARNREHRNAAKREKYQNNREARLQQMRDYAIKNKAAIAARKRANYLAAKSLAAQGD